MWGVVLILESCSVIIVHILVRSYHPYGMMFAAVQMPIMRSLVVPFVIFTWSNVIDAAQLDYDGVSELNKIGYKPNW